MNRYKFVRLGDKGRIQRRTWWTLWLNTEYMVSGGQYWFGGQEYAWKSWMDIRDAVRIWDRMFPEPPKGAQERAAQGGES